MAAGPPISPGVQDKIDQIEKQASSTSDLTVDSSSRVDKRKSECSPEASELSRKEKKQLKEGEKKQDKMRKKLEYKEKNSVQVLVNHSFYEMDISIQQYRSIIGRFVPSQ